MNCTKLKLTFLCSLAAISMIAAAAPDNPVGGIIVKGGRNPDGKVLVLATSDLNGGFSAIFSEEGEYRLEFVNKPEQPDQQIESFNLDYVVDHGRHDAESSHIDSVRTTILTSDLRNTPVLIVVPRGGAKFTGRIMRVIIEKKPDVDAITSNKGINKAGIKKNKIEIMNESKNLSQSVREKIDDKEKNVLINNQKIEIESDRIDKKKIHGRDLK